MSVADELMAKARGVHESEEGTSRQALRKVVRRHAAYASNQQWIETMFRKFDEDNSGYIEEAEVRGLLKELSPDGIVTDDDLAYIWGQCDPDNDGKISRDELLPLAATWNVVAKKNADRRASRADDCKEMKVFSDKHAASSKACVIL